MLDSNTTAAMICAIGTMASGQTVVPIGEVSTCQMGVAGTLANTSVGFDGTGAEFSAPETWNFHTFYGVAGQVVDFDVNREVGALDPHMNLYLGDATGLPLADFSDLSTASTNGALTLLVDANDEDEPWVSPGPNGDPFALGFVLPSTGVYTLVVGGNTSDGGAVSYDYSINMTVNTADVNNITQATNHPTLQDAVDNAVAGDVIEIGTGTLCENVLVDRALTIHGAGMDSTVLDGGLVGRAMDVSYSGAQFTLEGMTIMNGFIGGRGGGAQIGSGMDAELVGVRFMNNTGTQGGGLRRVGGAAADSFFNLDGCEFIDNTATSCCGGGFIHLFGGDFTTVRNCLFRGNVCGGNGHAIYFQPSADMSPNIVNCTFVDQPSATVWAISNNPGTVTVTNCVFRGLGVTTKVATIAMDAVISNTVLAGGFAFGGTLADGGGNTFDSPAFEDEGAWDFRLAAGSVGIDMGDTAAWGAAGGGFEDALGQLRVVNDPNTTDTGPLGSVIDAGCYEFQTPFADTSCDGDSNSDGTVDVNDITYVLFRLGNPCP